MKTTRIDPDTVSSPMAGGYAHAVRVELAGLPAIREIRREYLGADPPASTLVEVKGLVHPDALIEVDVVAVISTT